MTEPLIPSSDTTLNPAVMLEQLPEPIGQVMDWIAQQGGASLAEVIGQFQFYEAEAQGYVEALVQLGYLDLQQSGLLQAGTESREVDPGASSQLASSSGETWRSLPSSPTQRYQPSLDFSRQRLAQSAANSRDIAPTQPLSVILSAASELLVVPGSLTELNVTVINQGPQGAVIDIFLDDLPPALHDWCVSTQEHLALSRGQSGTVNFSFQVPVEALPGFYGYWLTVDSPQHYSNSAPLRYEHSLQVLTPSETAVQVNDPTFALLPSTTSIQPARAFANTPLQFQVTVYNRTDRVDRFRLTCTDLPPSWIQISYPQGFQTPGLAVQENFLDLNPGAENIILLTVTPPTRAIAQTYLSTLRLQSENHSDLALLEVLYFAVEPTYQCDVSLRTLVSRIRTQPGRYSVQLSNQGNTSRQIDLTLITSPEDKPLFDFRLRQAHFSLAPGQTLTSDIEVLPKHPLRRPLFGGGRVVTFTVQAVDPEAFPLPDIPMQGTLFWEARPWWQMMPLSLLTTGSFLALFWLAWWYFMRPPTPPQILDFSPESTEYSEVSGDPVRLNFQVAHPRRIQTIEIIGQSAEGEVMSGPLRFDLSNGLPAELEPFCRASRAVLNCRNLRTDAILPATYTFVLRVIPKAKLGAAPVLATSPPVEIAAIPLPQIVSFASTPGDYVASSPTASSEALAKSGIPLNWVIEQVENLKALQFVGKDEAGKVLLPAIQFDLEAGLPELLKAHCSLDTQLVCKGLPALTRTAGNYIFELTAIPKRGLATLPVATDPITVLPRPLQLQAFTVNGQAVMPDSQLTVELGAEAPVVTVAWAVENNPGTQVSILPAPGMVGARGSVPIRLNPIPGEQLVTLQVTNAAGEQLTRTVPIQVKAPAPQLNRFMLDGKPVQPNYLIPVDQGMPPKPITLAWDVKDVPGTKVSLSPAPGMVGLQGSVMLQLSPQPGEQLITLQVVNAAGEQLVRTVAITTFDPTPGPDVVVMPGDEAEATAPGSAASGAAGGKQPGQPALVPNASRPGQVAPVELPPVFR